MNLADVLLVSASLSIDACAVALACGLSQRESRVRGGLVVGATFGAMSGLAPFAGAAAGGLTSELFARVDHWIAFGLLAGLGLKSLWEARRAEAPAARDASDWLRVLVASLAISVDTLAAGLSFALVREPIAPLALFSGAITGVGSGACFLAAGKLGPRFHRTGMVVGGVVLIAIAIHVLREHADHL